MNSELGLQISVSSWRITDTAAFGITVTSVLSPKIIYEAGVSAGVAEAAAELRKHKHNNTKVLGIWMAVHSTRSGNICSRGVKRHATLFLHSHPHKLQ